MNDGQAPRLSGDVSSASAIWAEVTILLDDKSIAYISENFNRMRPSVITTLEVSKWRRLLRYLETGLRKVEFDLVSVGAGDLGNMTIENLAGVDGAGLDWTASEYGVIVI
ncbi:MAG: hypothetical protein OHK93_000105 [Ramalina farinacea]|uniref:Uncharacterized protein n=1 Tax=Ramalina farinacea TaxID=258253 RepID=A0AA43QE95_9LECA|nr:hypothetical protein [Ramalina farinacea]